MGGTVSVALCTHNGAAHLEEQLLSILAQGRPVDEIVLSDDASTDDTMAIVARVFGNSRPAGSRPELTILRNPEPLGVTGNFQRALTACTGEFVALCDQDDVWHPDRISTALAVFEHAPHLALVHSDAWLIDATGRRLGPTLFEALDLTAAERAEIHSGEGFSALLRRNLVTGATVMVRGSLIARALPFPPPWVHDEWMAMIAGATADFDLVQDQLIDYRQHGANQIGVRKLGLTGKIRRVFEPRGDRNSYLLERAVVLRDRLTAMGDLVSPEKLHLAQQKVEHLRARNALARSRPLRWSSVLRELRTGRYAEFSRGRGDILRDLLQKSGDASERSR